MEVVGEPGSGRLSLALSWLAAARPLLAAVVDLPAQPTQPGSRSQAAQGVPAARAGLRRPAAAAPSEAVGRFYPPAAASAGVDLARLIIVRPPAAVGTAGAISGARRNAGSGAVLEALVVLLRSEAFDVVLCSLPAGTRIGTSLGARLASLAARSGTSLLLLTEPVPEAARWAGGAGALAAFAEYRVRLTGRRWLWQDGELAGLRLRVATERARGGPAQPASSAPGARHPAHAAPGLVSSLVQHDLTFRLRRQVRDGPAQGGQGGIDGFYLAGSVRADPKPEAPGHSEYSEYRGYRGDKAGRAGLVAGPLLGMPDHPDHLAEGAWTAAAGR
jgi:hypothetical protein